jgi:uncharacterized protein YeaO (DUF488 family)
VKRRRVHNEDRPFDPAGDAMPIRIVQLGSPRHRGEGPRLGTVRRPPRGVPKSLYAARDFYDVWLPELAPSAELLGSLAGGAPSPKFFARYRAEMGRPPASRILDLLTALSESSSFSVGCYCVAEEGCHRSVLRQLLAERGAKIED